MRRVEIADIKPGTLIFSRPDVDIPVPTLTVDGARSMPP
jgi:hypothetical protein